MKLSREEVLKAAAECGFEIVQYGDDQWIRETDDMEPFERFATAMYEAGVKQRLRAGLADVCDKLAKENESNLKLMAENATLRTALKRSQQAALKEGEN